MPLHTYGKRFCGGTRVLRGPVQIRACRARTWPNGEGGLLNRVNRISISARCSWRQLSACKLTCTVQQLVPAIPPANLLYFHIHIIKAHNKTKSPDSVPLLMEPSRKRQRPCEDDDGDESRDSPTSFITWNCNGFISRCKWDPELMKSLLEDMNYPDMICIQEARLKASGTKEDQRGIPKPSEYIEIQSTIEQIFQRDYHPPIWSLADARYAGTVTFIHKRLRTWKEGGSSSRSRQCAFSSDSAIDLTLQQCQRTREQIVGLSVPITTTRLTGTDTQGSTPTKNKQQQRSITSFFAPKGSPTKTTTTTSPNMKMKVTSGTSVIRQCHHPEGRFQFFSFPTMDVLQTYVPNNGTKEESFQRRKEWDDMMLRFLKDRKAILKQTNNPNRCLLWCGDFNCAKDYRDGTHWVKKEDGTIYEFWTDPIKCQVGKPGDEPPEPENAGIPSFTPNERRRFAKLIKEGDFVDIWRNLHPDGTMTSTMKPWDRPDYTWRGHLARNGATYNAKFQGKGQRLDYFLLSPSNMISKVSQCQILGFGERRDGHFCGSDHCASILRLNS